MADKTKRQKAFQAMALFNDGDTRIVSIEDPKDGITRSSFDSINAAAVLIGDKGGASFAGWEGGKYKDTTVVYYDLSLD